jgi:hypothetical protein
MIIVITCKEENDWGTVEELVSHGIDEDTLEIVALPNVPISWMKADNSAKWCVDMQEWILNDIIF